MNYAALVTAIEDFCQSTETSFVTHIPDFVKMAEQEIYNAVQLPNLRKHVTGVTTASNRYLTAPTDFLAAFTAAVLTPVTGIYNEMMFRDVDWMREAFPDPASTGVPKYYGLWDSATFVLSATPAAAYTVEMHYYYKPTSIVTSSTSWVGDNFDMVLLYGSLVHAYTYQKGEKELTERYKELFKEGLVVLSAVGDDKSKERKV